jgi:competence ComEA-like helix-hairpin-helix protein
MSAAPDSSSSEHVLPERQPAEGMPDSAAVVHRPRPLPGVDWDDDRPGPGFLESLRDSFQGRQRTLLHWLLVGLLFLLAADWCWVVSRRPQALTLERGEGFQQFRVDINNADWIEWAQLEGIGPTLAHRIVADREANGPFLSVDDVGRVPGIGPAKLDRIREWLTIGHDPVATSFRSRDSTNGSGSSAGAGIQQPAAF